MSPRIQPAAGVKESAIPADARSDDQRFAALRRAMVEEQIRARGISSERVLEAMRTVPRHLFVPPERIDSAYADHPIEIGEGQTISQPFMVAAMAAVLELRGTETVLEVGTGSGYSAAVLSLLAARIYTVEKYPMLAESARQRLDGLGYRNVFVEIGDGSAGFPSGAPFDAIAVAAAAPKVPAPLAEQLAEGGRLVVPVGESENQELVLATKTNGTVSSRVVAYCRFVPLMGRYGFGG